MTQFKNIVDTMEDMDVGDSTYLKSLEQVVVEITQSTFLTFTNVKVRNLFVNK